MTTPKARLLGFWVFLIGIGSGSHFKLFRVLTSYKLGMKSLKHIFYSFFFSDNKIMYLIGGVCRKVRNTSQSKLKPQKILVIMCWC